MATSRLAAAVVVSLRRRRLLSTGAIPVVEVAVIVMSDSLDDCAEVDTAAAAAGNGLADDAIMIMLDTVLSMSPR